MNKEELIAFEDEVARLFALGTIHGPVHLSGGNEDQLIEIFKEISPDDWVFCTWRHDYHALLHGIPPEALMAAIKDGKGMGFSSPEHNFFVSAVVGGILPIAVGVAHALKMSGREQKVWCFVGDMAATLGIFHEATNYAYCQDLPICFVVEDNRKSAETPTYDAWGPIVPIGTWNPYVHEYEYESTRPHVGIGHNVFPETQSCISVNHQWFK